MAARSVEVAYTAGGGGRGGGARDATASLRRGDAQGGVGHGAYVSAVKPDARALAHRHKDQTWHVALSAGAYVAAQNIKGLRDRNSPKCTLSQNGYGD